MKVTVIGGSGNIGTYLVPRLIMADYDVTVISRGSGKPHLPHKAWDKVTMLSVDRTEAEKKGIFSNIVVETKPDIVIDLISFTLGTTQPLVEALRGKIQHFLHCGSIWTKGVLMEIPSTEDTVSEEPLDQYGKDKKQIEEYLLKESRQGNFPATIIKPGHITCPGYIPVTPLGTRNPEVFSILAQGKPLAIPNFGMETLHHVHADDIAQAFMKSIENWSASVGEHFNICSNSALSLRSYAITVAKWFGKEANLNFHPYDEWKKICGWSDWDIESCYRHIMHSQCCSIEKAKRHIGYEPTYTSSEAVREALNWLIEKGTVII